MPEPVRRDLSDHRPLHTWHKSGTSAPCSSRLGVVLGRACHYRHKIGADGPMLPCRVVNSDLGIGEWDRSSRAWVWSAERYNTLALTPSPSTVPSTVHVGASLRVQILIAIRDPSSSPSASIPSTWLARSAGRSCGAAASAIASATNVSMAMHTTARTLLASQLPLMERTAQQLSGAANALVVRFEQLAASFDETVSALLWHSCASRPRSHGPRSPSCSATTRAAGRTQRWARASTSIRPGSCPTAAVRSSASRWRCISIRSCVALAACAKQLGYYGSLLEAAVAARCVLPQ